MLAQSSSVDSVIPEYLVCCQTEGKSPRTVNWYGQKLGYFAAFLQTNALATHIDRIGPPEIRQFIHHLQQDVKAGENYPPFCTQANQAIVLRSGNLTKVGSFIWAIMGNTNPTVTPVAKLQVCAQTAPGVKPAIRSAPRPRAARDRDSATGEPACFSVQRAVSPAFDTARSLGYPARVRGIGREELVSSLNSRTHMGWSTQPFQAKR
jgi:hypothetical protein